MSLPALAIIDDPKQAATLLQHPIRRRVLHELRHAQSASQLAKLIHLPRQKVNYHLRELEKAGLVTTIEERQRGNAKERIVVASAAHYLVDPTLIARDKDLPDSADRFSLLHLVSTMAKGIRELLRIRRGAAIAQQRVATLTIESQVSFADAQSRHDYSQALANEIARLNAQYHRPHEKGARAFTVLLGAWPSATKPELTEQDEWKT